MKLLQQLCTELHFFSFSFFSCGFKTVMELIALHTIPFFSNLPPTNRVQISILRYFCEAISLNYEDKNTKKNTLLLPPAVRKKKRILVMTFHSITIIYLNITYQSILAPLHRQKDRMKYRKFKKKKQEQKKLNIRSSKLS